MEVEYRIGSSLYDLKKKLENKYYKDYELVSIYTIPASFGTVEHVAWLKRKNGSQVN